MAHVRVMFAEEEQAIAGRAPDSYVSLAANHKGKPGETSRRKAMGSKAAPAMTARLLIMISKPPEMTGRKAMGAKAAGFRNYVRRKRYASPAAGYFASENTAKKGRIV